MGKRKSRCTWLSLLLAVSLTGCNGTVTPAEEETVEEDPVVIEIEDIQENTLVLYFSRPGENWRVGTVEKGSTQILAELIAQTKDADLFRIETEVPYPESYDETTAIAKEEQTANARPVLVAYPEDLGNYDTVYLGYPIWWGDLPMAVYAALENGDFTGVTVYPFCTHGGSGLAGTVETIRNIIPEANVQEGIAISGELVQKSYEEAQEQLLQWLEKEGE